MKKALLKVTVMLLCLAGVTPVMAQFNLKKAVGGAFQGSDRAGRVGRFCIARFPTCNFPGWWRIHHQEGGRLQPRRNQGAEVHQRNTQSTRLFHVCETFSCRWHNYKPSRWNAPQRRLFRPCSRRFEQQAVQRHHGYGRKIFIRCP